MMLRLLLVLSLQLFAVGSLSAQRTFSYQGRSGVTSDSVLLVDNKKTVGRQHVFRTVEEALRRAEERSARGLSTTVYLQPAVYWLDNPDDPTVRVPRQGSTVPFALSLRMSRVRLVGLGDKAEDVVLAVNRGQTQGAEGNFTMLHIVGSDIAAENITFGNYCNVDLNYRRDPRQSRPRRKDAIVQAQIAICKGSSYRFRNCRFISRLNLCPFVGADDTVYDDCYFECTDDALTGNALYRHCRFTLFSSKPFYTTDKQQGARFEDCELHSKTRGTQYLTKVSGPVEMVRCRWTSDDPNLQIKWNKRPDPQHRCTMTDCTLNGQPLLVPQPTAPLPVSFPPVLLARQPKIIPGRWTVDCHKPLDTYHYDWQPDTTRSAWGYAEGVDGAEGIWGLVQVQRGARLMFTPLNEHDSVTRQRCVVTLDPCKGPGQGFGSATGQYLDICIKFSTRTLTGYGIRFERTPDYDKAVAVSLVEYADGKVSSLTEPQRCNLFRPGCSVELVADGSLLRAVVSNKHLAHEEQSLQVQMPHPNGFAGFHLQHTGSTGASATVVRTIMME